MHIAIISDSHDNIWKLEEALPYLAQADVVIHCGDLVAPFMMKLLSRGIKGKPLHVVWGNNDGDKPLLTKIAEEAGNVHLHGDLAKIVLGDLRVAVTHYPEIARELAEDGKYDLVCYGHDHTANEEYVCDTLLLNPGELMGMNGKSTFANLDSETMIVNWIVLD